MNLFTTKNQKNPIKSEPLEISTPVGYLFFNVEFSNGSLQSIKPSKIEAINQQTTLFSWEFEDCVIEFLKLKFFPKLPSGLHVDDCMCGIWRINALRNINHQFTFTCYLKSDLMGSPESGEGLECQSFENENFKLSIGTEDQDYLLRRMNALDWFPSRFQSTQEEIEIEYFSKGIKVILPDLCQNEKVQVQFIAAWASKTNNEVSTWYAVDQSAKRLLEAAGII